MLSQLQRYTRHVLVSPASKRLCLSVSVRSFAARRRRTAAVQKADTHSVENLAFALLKPEDPSDAEASWTGMLNPFKPVRRGPALWAVTTFRQDSGDHFEKKVVVTNQGQDRMWESLFMNFPHLARAEGGQRGTQNENKLVPGATVVANMSPNTNPFDIAFAKYWGIDATSEAISRNANLNQAYGTVVQVNRDGNGNVASADVNFEGLWFEEYAVSMNLHYPTETGFYACVHPSRLLVHANFRNIFAMTTFGDLRWELSLVWPEAVNLEEEIEFFDGETQEKLNPKVGKTIRDLIEGRAIVKIRGRPIPVLDPMGVLPKGFKLW
eukprot:TRINITY_DN50209_c0_g1_i1.p1 TRINITY_DN50209_c0_g1~~TRINITY_DN50209_c0_g1_i1.p1  ORF type:complete len:324 (+),score=46.48 TRINITY_DN50209_c0_g1_i1:16-987(+)